MQQFVTTYVLLTPKKTNKHKTNSDDNYGEDDCCGGGGQYALIEDSKFNFQVQHQPPNSKFKV